MTMYVMCVDIRLTPDDYRRFVLNEYDGFDTVRKIAFSSVSKDFLRSGGTWPEPIMNFLHQSNSILRAKKDFDEWMQGLLSCAPCEEASQQQPLVLSIGEGSAIMVYWLKAKSEFLPPKYTVESFTRDNYTRISISPCLSSMDEWHRKEEE